MVDVPWLVIFPIEDVSTRGGFFVGSLFIQAKIPGAFSVEFSTIDLSSSRDVSDNSVMESESIESDCCNTFSGISASTFTSREKFR